LWLKSSLLLALALAPAAAATTGDIIRARDLCYRQEYDSAFALVRTRLLCDTNDPAGLYWQASLIQLLIYDSGDKSLADSFRALSDHAVALCRRNLHRNPDDAQAHFYLGMIQLNRATFLGWQQRSLSAFKVLFGVTPQLNAALAADPTLTDAQLGIGVVEYFKASADRYVLGLSLLGSKKKAFRLVTAVADRDGMMQTAAEFLLGYMLKEDGDGAGALRYCRKLLGKYPGNRTAMRMTRDAYYQGGDYALSLATGRRVEEEVLKETPGNRYALSENWVVCGKAFAKLGQKDSALVRFDRVIAWEPYADEVPWLPNYVREAKQWRKKLGK
jgi:tetratricopeptide (TPR) repeat protein